MRSSFATVLLCAGLAAQVPEQPQQTAPPLEQPIVEQLLLEITTRLGSDKPDSVAWGAYLAGRFRLAEAVPEIRKALERDYADGIEGRLTRLHLLDALVRLDGAAPMELLAANAKGLTLAPSLIVMARQPVANRALLRDLFEQHAGPRGDPMVWRVAGNLLAAQMAPGFAAHLVRSTPLDLHVLVSDRADVQFSVGARAGGAFGDGRMEVPMAFPPTPRYRLVEKPVAGDVLLVDGPVGVFWRRTERTERSFGVGSRRTRIDPRRDHLRWLEWMAGGGAAVSAGSGAWGWETSLGLQLVSYRSVVFEGAEEFLSRVADMRKELSAAYDRFLEKLVQAAVLTSDEARGLSMDLRVTVHDQRVDKSVELPEIPIR